MLQLTALLLTLVCCVQGSNPFIKGRCSANCTYDATGQLKCKRLLAVNLLKVQCCQDARGHFFQSLNGIEECEKCEACGSQAYNPICATNGVTYSSVCELRSAACRMPHINVKKSYNGECRKTCDLVQCDDGYECALDERGKPTCVAPCDDSQISTQVCGSDGVTYSNQCALQRAWIGRQKLLTVAYQGACSDNVTCASLKCFKQRFLIKFTQGSWMTPRMDCITDRLSGTPRCMATMVSNCERARKVCGSDGKVYNDYCELLQKVQYTLQAIDVQPMSDCQTRN